MFVLKQLKQEQQNADGGEAPIAQAQDTLSPEGTSSTSTPEVTPVTVETTPTVTEPVAVDYSTPAAKQVGTMLEDAGVDLAKAKEALKSNNGSCTPEIYKALVDKHGEGMASLLAGQLTKLYETGVAKSTAADEAVYSQVQKEFEGVTEQSGKETFAELKTWATENVSTEDRKELNAAIAQGGFVAKLAIQELTNAFKQSGDFNQDMIGLSGDSVADNSNGGTLTRHEYTTQLDALLEKGHVYGQSKEIDMLDSKRARSAKRGI